MSQDKQDNNLPTEPEVPTEVPEVPTEEMSDILDQVIEENQPGKQVSFLARLLMGDLKKIFPGCE